MRVDVVTAGFLGLLLAGSAGAGFLLASFVPAAVTPGPCPQVHLVAARGPAGRQVFEVDAAAEPRPALHTWAWLQPGRGQEAVAGDGQPSPYGTVNLHDSATRMPGGPWFEDAAPVGVVSRGDRFVLPHEVPVRLTLLDDEGNGIGGTEGCGSPDYRMGMSPGPAACYGIFLERSEPEGGEAGNGTRFRVVSAAARWSVAELDYQLATSDDAFLGGNLTSIAAPDASPLRFVDAEPRGEVNPGDAFRYASAAQGLTLRESATGRGVGGSYLCL